MSGSQHITIDLEPGILAEVKKILKQHIPELEVRIFSSRLVGKARKYSDLDLIVIPKKDTPAERLDELREAFSESDIPIIIDVLNYNELDASFRAAIEKQGYQNFFAVTSSAR